MKKLMLCVLFAVALPGCAWFSDKHPQMAEIWPVYDRPGRPILDIPDSVVPGKDPNVDKLIKNLYNSLKYAESLEIIIDTHKKVAEAHNESVRNSLGVGKK